MFKNLSIRELTYYVTIAVFGVTFLLSFFFLKILDVNAFQKENLYWFIAFQVISFLLIYGTIRFLLEGFIFRRIKLIYKVISESKLSSSSPKPGFDPKEYSLDEVNLDVLNWAQKTQDEIQDLKTLEEYRKKYVGDISHELKTPIFSIQGYIHTLLEGGLYDEKINEKYLLRAAKNIERLQTIVDDLELINKLEYGKAVLYKSKFDIKKLVQEVMQDLTVQASEKKISIHFKEGADQPRQVYADLESIRQVISNLLLNSIKYGNKEGETRIGFYDMGEKVLIEISDNGIGIEEEHLKHVFDRFYRVDASRSRKQGGSGLGLSIVKHIIEAHQENINVRSTQGVGSTFGFTLPKNK